MDLTLDQLTQCRVSSWIIKLLAKYYFLMLWWENFVLQAGCMVNGPDFNFAINVVKKNTFATLQS